MHGFLKKRLHNEIKFLGALAGPWAPGLPAWLIPKLLASSVDAAIRLSTKGGLPITGPRMDGCSHEAVDAPIVLGYQTFPFPSLMQLQAALNGTLQVPGSKTPQPIADCYE